ncbi:hypothetical protein DRE_00125 [Drechslerella stenobrocha 248]|uniref:Uncharacterized protein n=1 Tax=Drechslerella stenobrocha 248 TaxID=1043628 RepID=W7IHS3_9PEZI|nr:hypothetical protein DRE_00125 [Drechslerella stenobrocha 248]
MFVSQISIGFSYAIRKALGATKQHNTITPYLSFEILSVILERDRPCEKKILVGSTTDEPSIAEARGLGYEVNILRRVPGQAPQNDEPKPASGKSKGKNSSEQAVDEIIIMKILESLVDHPPSTIVLATGDGNAAEFGDGFIKTIERSLQRGWNVELVAFRHNLNNSWKKLGSPKFHIILLDGYLVDLTRLDQNITLTKEKGKKK